MNNFLSYCGLVDASISASGKKLPVTKTKEKWKDLEILGAILTYPWFSHGGKLCIFLSRNTLLHSFQNVIHLISFWSQYICYSQDSKLFTFDKVHIFCEGHKVLRNLHHK